MGYRNAFLIIKGGGVMGIISAKLVTSSVSTTSIISNSSVVSAEKSSITVAFETATFSEYQLLLSIREFFWPGFQDIIDGNDVGLGRK
jgi:hypothetical protein